MSGASFIASQRAAYDVPHALSYKALGVSESWFYKWHRCWAGLRKGVEKWRTEYEAAGFGVVDSTVEASIASTDVLLGHFPYEGDSREASRYSAYRPADRGGWLLHGHVHERWRQRGRQVNVGGDAWGGRPVAEDEVAALIQAGPADLTPFPWHAVPGSA